MGIERFPMNLQEYGNTSSASIPILLHEMNRNGKLKKGQKLVLAGFGAGLSWGGICTGMGYLKINSKIRDIAEKEIIMLQKIIEITAETLGAEAESITENTSFTEDLHADSLDLFELAMALEEEFGVEIPSEDLEKITTVGAAAAYLEENK